MIRVCRAGSAVALVAVLISFGFVATIATMRLAAVAPGTLGRSLKNCEKPNEINLASPREVVQALSSEYLRFAGWRRSCERR